MHKLLLKTKHVRKKQSRLGMPKKISFLLKKLLFDVAVI